MSPDWIGELAGERKNLAAVVREIERLAAAGERQRLPWVFPERTRSGDPMPAQTAARRPGTPERGFWDSTAGKVVASAVPFGGLISAIASLFGGREQEEPAPLVRFAKPDPVRVEAGLIASEDRVRAVTRGQGHQARAVPEGATNITVQVQAMDSRSFLEHSREIADAVRLAMLSGHEVNDAVREL